MCGIVGYIGEKNATPILLTGLEKLEYRGYDSAGVAVLTQKKLKVIKCKGRLCELTSRLKVHEYQVSGTLGIGHTRWATHGVPNDVNSHPHISQFGKVAVVHNGIIENYMELKHFLMDQGAEFVSDTDTEVIAHLVEYYYEGDLAEAVRKCIKKLEGSYSLGVICKECDDTLIAVKKDSPLVVGLGNKENFIASDIPALLQHTRQIYILEDKEIAVLTKESVQILDVEGNRIEKEIFSVDWDVEATEKSGYEHFMLKEIEEEPRVIRDTMAVRMKQGQIDLQNISFRKEDILNVDKIYIVACGTAYHAGLIGKYIIEKLARMSVEVEVASEFRYKDPLVSDRTLVIIISQSGETLDTLSAMREAKKRGAKTLAIVNVVGSSIAREADKVMYTLAGPEIAVASTKAYNAQLTALYLIAINLAYDLDKISKEEQNQIVSFLKAVPEHIEEIINQKSTIQRLASEYSDAKNVFFIGRGLDYALSMEGSLKLKEISYIHSEAYAGGELKHGTIALIEEGTLVICPMTQEALLDKMISNIREVKSRGAVVIAVTQEKNTQVTEVADEVIFIPNIDPRVAPVSAVSALQLFAYYMADIKGCDVDKPRNLAKSVTVE